MLKAIVWKEWRQQRALVLAILILMPIVLGVFGWVSGIFADGVGGPVAEKLGSICWLVACFQAIVTGSVLFAGESETGTLDFLDSCSAERSRIWFAKMASGLAITLPIALLPMLFAGFEGLLLAGFVLETLVLAAAASVFVRTTFRAIGATIVSLILILCIEGPILGAIERFRPDHRIAYVAIVGLNLANVGAAACISWRRFCRTGREGLSDNLGSLIVRVPPGWLTGPLWMLLRRQWMSLLAVGLGLVGFYVWIHQATDEYGRYGRMDALAPALLFAIGCVCGGSVYALESAGTERFLGDQRFPRGRLWLAKAGFWLALTILPALPIAVASFQQAGYFPPDASWLDRRGITNALPMLVLGMLGFTAGHLFGIHDSRLPVTIVLTLLVAAPIGAVWYAPLYGGAPAWPLGVIPILLLAAGRFELRRWTAGRLDGAAHWIRCGLIVLVCFAWTGLLVSQRAMEVPDVGEPFVAVESTTETPQERERNQRIASLAKTAQSRFGQVRGDPNKNREEYARTLNDAFAGDWSTSLRNEVIDEPRRLVAVGERNPIPRSLDDVAYIFRLRSNQLLAEGKTKAALDEFATSLAIVRHRVRFGGFPGEIDGFYACFVEDEMLDAAEAMLERGGSDPELCRGLLAVLNRHAQEMPTFSELIKASYSVTMERSSEYRSRSRWPIAFLFEVGPEAIRDDRLQRAFCRGLLKAAEQKSLFVNPTRPYGMWYGDRAWPARYLALATPDLNADDWARILSHQCLNEDVRYFSVFYSGFRVLPIAVARLAEVRLACAAALFRHDHGRDIESLAELAPECFPTLPESPFVECAFVYRRSPGETWKVFYFDEETAKRRTIAPGTGVIEMTGTEMLKVAVPQIKASRGP